MIRQVIAPVFALTVALGATTVTASAADMRMPVKAPPPPAPVFTWTGFYIGLNGGYSWGRGDATVFPNTAQQTTLSARVDGWLAGGQVGYNWQVDRTWVLGLEADIQGTGERGRANTPLSAVRTPTPGNDFNILITNQGSAEWRLPWFATFRGRVGVLADPTWLFYATGGLAVGDVRVGTSTTTTAQLFGPGSQGTTPQGPAVIVTTGFSETRTRVGWTVGAGTEKKFDNHWSVKLEYLYVDLGRETYFSGTAGVTSSRFWDHIARVGVNYQF